MFSMKKSLSDIPAVVISHKAGMKRVLLNAEESDCRIFKVFLADILFNTLKMGAWNQKIGESS